MGKMHEKQGSITIEASLLMPLIIGTIVFVIFASFYEHDRCLMLKTGYSMAIKAEEEETEALAYEAASRELREVFCAKATGLWDIETDIWISEGRLGTKLKGKMKLTGITGLFADSSYLQFQSRASGSLEKPSDYVRKRRRWGVGYCY